MYAEERLQLILGRARADGRVDVAALAAELDVTPETVRRDLNAPRAAGPGPPGARRCDPGRAARLRAGAGHPVRGADRREGADRQGRARRAARVRERSCWTPAPPPPGSRDLMPSDKELTVVTNSVPDRADPLGATRTSNVLVTGGRVRCRTLAGVGDWAVSALSGIRVDVAFLGTNGISAEHGLTTPDQAEAAVKRAMIACARRTIVVCGPHEGGRRLLRPVRRSRRRRHDHHRRRSRRRSTPPTSRPPDLTVVRA